VQTRVLIVEDQTALAENLIEFFGDEHYSLDFAADGLTALHLLAHHAYDVVILDVMLPAISGFEICRRIREDLRNNTPVIFMTAKGALTDKEEGFALGGDDYLVKPFALRELQLRVDALARRKGSAAQHLQAGPLAYDPETLELQYQRKGSLTLSGSSSRIFEALIRKHPRFVTYEELSQVVWGTDNGDTHTLRTHVYALRKALQSAFGQSLIRTVHGRGYRLELQSTSENAVSR